jgi:hypothetical protein
MGILVLRQKVSRQCVAWLALLAMAFIVVMPAISRVMPMDGAMPGMGAPCPEHQAATKHPVSPNGPTDPTDKCGYCVLLNHAPLLASGKVLHLLPVAPNPAAPVVARADDAYTSPILSANPRGPPRIG